MPVLDMSVPFPVMAVVALLHILDWVKQEHCALESEAIDWREDDMLLGREDCSWRVLTHNSITARLAWRRGTNIRASMPLTTSSSLYSPPCGCLIMSSSLESFSASKPVPRTTVSSSSEFSLVLSRFSSTTFLLLFSLTLTL